ncbi:MAG: hypothetical protein P4L53_08030 [Candidatus Obscuribacterales bacterium]|nr:hypothetical protein [Candidatus Obscuribacterales bacterium]
MNSLTDSQVTIVDLPWSDGLLSARLWSVGSRKVVGVPELGLHCYGVSQTEAVFRLFTSLLKYYRQLKANRDSLPEKAVRHLELLSVWVSAIERKMTYKEEAVASSNHIVNIRTPRF